MATDITHTLLDTYNQPGPRYTSYPPVPYWDTSFGEHAYRAALEGVANDPQATLSLYLHVPFCAARCFYCGCNATVTQRPEVVDGYLDRLARELDLLLDTLGRGRYVVQLHLGGGTPNFLSSAQLQRLISLLYSAFAFDTRAERSIEIDPRIGTPQQLAELRQLGFNRISFGVQDTDPLVQQAIGRIQPLERTTELVRASYALGFSSVNLDLVYGLPGQNERTFARTLEAAIALAPDRLACFSYAHVPWMHANQKRIDASALPDAYAKFDLFRQAVATLQAAGYSWIGLDHFARTSDELAVALRERRLHRNFMGYTTAPAQHMLALGTSAISEIGGCYAQNDAKLGNYNRALASGVLPIVRGHRLTPDDQLRRAVITHLMCNLELPNDLTTAQFGQPLDALLGPELERVRSYAADGFVAQQPNRLVVTELGRFFLRNLCMEFDAHRGAAASGPRFSKTI